MPHADFSLIRREIRDAARREFSEIRSKAPGESFYTFALYSDGDATTVCPAANTEQGYERRVKKYRSDREFMEMLKSFNLPFSPFDYRWGTNEWAHLHGGSGHFAAVSAKISADDAYDATADDGFAKHKGRVFAAMLLGLKDLDAEGFFGVGEQRERIILFCSATDASETAWLEEESARRLNSAAAYQSFFDQWITNTVMAENLADHKLDLDDDEVYREFSLSLEAG
ncbi:DUF4303 domain-containing protein [Isosphaeraceae bacterium EP7]